MEETPKLNFKRELEALATIRDELKVKAHLAKADLRDELERLEKKWLRVEEELQRTKRHAQQEVQSLSNDAKTLLSELKQGYENAKRKLS